MTYTNKKGETFDLKEGSRGGYYYIDSNNVKHYVKKTSKLISGKATKKVTTIKPTKSKYSFKEPELHTYICYYREESEEGEMLDDFKEWCEASSIEEARNYFKDNYRHNPLVKIDNIVKEK